MADELRAAVAAGALAAEESYRPLLQAIVEVARAILGARASSVMLLDEPAGELVFEAVTGEGENELVGRRIPASTGIAGWVAQSRQPLVVEDVTQDPRFSLDTARGTGRLVPALSEAWLVNVNCGTYACSTHRPEAARQHSCAGCSGQWNRAAMSST